MSPDSLSSDTFFVEMTQGGEVAGTVQVDGTIATFTPEAPWAPDTQYTVWLTTALTDLAGNPLPANVRWSFTTSSSVVVGPDSPPQVVRTRPAPAEVGVSADTAVVVVFSEPVDPSTVTASTFTLQDASGIAVSGVLNVQDEEVTLTPAASLTRSTHYTVTLTTGITDLDASPLEALVSWEFVTEAEVTVDDTPPTVTLVSPMDGAQSTPRNATVGVAFSEAVDPATLDASSFVLTDEQGRAVAGTVALTGNTATFTPADPLLMAATYTARVTTAITDVVGNALTAEHSWSFTTLDGDWGNATALAADYQQGAMPYMVRMSPQGDAMVLWQQDDGVRRNLWARHLSATGGWAPASLLESEDENVRVMDLAMDGLGNVLVVWSQADGTEVAVNSRRYVPATGWEPLETIELAEGYVEYIGLGMNTQGAAVATWTRWDGTDRNVFAARSPGAGAWEAMEAVEQDPGMTTDVAVAVDAGGVATLLWRQWNGITNDLRARRTPGTGSWSPLATLDVLAGDLHGPQLALGPQGGAMALWQQEEGSSWRLWSARSAGANVWTTPDAIDPAGEAMGYPILRADAMGNFMAAWSQWENPYYRPLSSRYVPLIGWSTPEPLEHHSVNVQFLDLAVDPLGNAMAVWTLSTSGSEDVWSNRFNTVNGWTGAQIIETENDTGLWGVKVAMDTQGRALAVWSVTMGTLPGLWTNLFE